MYFAFSEVEKVNSSSGVNCENRRNIDLTLTTQPISERISNLQKEKEKDSADRNVLDISREASVKDLTERLQVIVFIILDFILAI